MSGSEEHSSMSTTPSPEPPLLNPAGTPGDQPPPSFLDRVSKYEASSFLIRQAAPGKFASVRETSFSENPDDDPVTTTTTTTTMADDTLFVTSPDASLVRRPRDLPPPLPPKPVEDQDQEMMSPSSPPEDIPPPPPPSSSDLKPILKKTPTSKSKPTKITTSTSSLSKTPKPKGIWFNMGDQYPVENFSGRTSLLDQLETIVTSPKSRDVRPISLAIVLAGDRGMGKTEIARKFAFRFYVEANGSGNVVWLDASSKEALRAQLSLLYDKEFVAKTPTIELSGDEVPTSPSEVIQSSSQPQAPEKSSGFKFKFSSPKNKDSLKKSNASSTSLEDEVETLLASKTFQKFPSLFVFDDAKSEEDIIQFLPKLSPIGFIPSVIVTSRNKQWNNSRLIPVSDFEFNEAVDFFQENLGQYPEFRRYQGEDLAKDLHRFPPLLQRAKAIVAHYVADIGSERALLRLEKNIGLVRRLKHDAPFHKMVEEALLAVDRGVFFEQDSYIREFDGELRNHPIMMTIRQLEAAVPLLTSVPNANILAVNADAYSLCLLCFMMDKFSRVDAVHARLIPTDVQVEQHPSVKLIDAHDPALFKNGKIQILAVDMTKPKTGTIKTTSLIEKFRNHEKKTYDLIITPTFEDDDVSTIRKMLNPGGLFVTSTSSANTTVLLKKNEPKKTEMKILKQESAQLLVTIRKL